MALNEGPQPLDLKRILRTLTRRRWAIAAFALSCTLLTGLYVFTVDPVYRATASLVLETQQANVVGVEEVYGVNRVSYDYAFTEFEILQSRQLAERVVRRLNLHEHPAFAGATASDSDWDLKTLWPAARKTPPVQLSEREREEQAIQRTTSAVLKALSFTPVKFSLLARVNFESSDPRLAAEVVNAIIEEFISSNLQNRLEGTLQATDWLDERLADLGEKLRASEQALQGFRDREGLVNIAGTTGLGGNELRSLSNRLDEVRKARIGAENIKKEVAGLGRASTEELMTVPAVLQHQLIRELKREQSTIERKAAELAKRYGPKHPKMIAARSDLAAANQELAKEVRKVVSGINREYEIALRNEEQLQAAWEDRKSEVQDFNRKEFELQELQRDVDTNRQLYDIFFSRIKAVSESQGFEKPHARMVDRATTPQAPIKPNKKLALVLALVMGLMLGGVVALVLEVLDNTVKWPTEVMDKLGAPSLGTLPKMSAGSDGEFEQYWINPHTHYAEAIRTLRTSLVLSNLDDPAKVIVITSTLPEEGKSTTALNIGAALGQMESTLVIGGDLRRPSLAQKCGLQANHLGLSHFVSGAVELEDCIEFLDAVGIHVMPAGVIPPNPLEMISSKRFIAALDVLKQRFDRIIIDSAPIHAVSDAMVLASYADSVVYIIKADATPASQARAGVARLMASTDSLTGVVMNQFQERRHRDYYSGDDYQYNS